MSKLTDDQLFATLVCDEAGNQPYEGKVAVAIVVLNRIARRYESDGTMMGTVLAHFQFSGFWFEMIDHHYTQICHSLADAQAQAMKLFLSFDSSHVYADAVRAIADARAWEAGQPMSFEPDAAFKGLTKNTVLYLNPQFSHATWAVPAKQDAVIHDHVFYHA